MLGFESPMASASLVLAGVIALASAAALAASPPEEDDEDDEDEADEDEAEGVARQAAGAVYEFSADSIDAELAPAPAAAESLGATPGGAKDVNLLRALIEQGLVPRPEQVTPEGLFSEHDLPLVAAAGCEQLLCVHAEVTDAALTSEPELAYLAQLGFSSSLKPSELQRPPLNLVFVVDQSSSMAGRPLEIVRESMVTIVGQLGANDRVTIIGFDERPHRRLEATPARDPAVAREILALEARGLSHLDAGVWAGVVAARSSSRRFVGSTRIMLFTDDRPTWGRDQPAAFVEAARAASADGIGVTTVGVGVRFDAALAREVAAVRGGNLLFFDDLERMRSSFEADFDTMVTELAHGLELVVEPAPGMRVADVYGLPASAIQRRGHGIALQVETLFASRRKGAIYFGLSPVGRANLPRVPARDGMQLGEVRLSYQEVGQDAGRAVQFSRATLTTVRRKTASLGLLRGSLLVDEAVGLRRAAELFHDRGDRAQASALMRRVHARFDTSGDAGLDEQRGLLARLLPLLDG